MNGLPCDCKLKELGVEDELFQRGVTHVFGDAGITILEECSLGLSLLYENLCEKGLFPPPYPIPLSLELEAKSPFGENRWLLAANAAYMGRFSERLSMEYDTYGVFCEDYKDLKDLRSRIEEVWISGMSLNVITYEKAKMLEKVAPHLYRELVNALKVTNSVKLWVTGDLATVFLAVVEDVTEVEVGELETIATKLIREAGEAQRRLIEIYREEAERALSRVPRSRVIEVEVDPCAAREWCVGGWVLASW